LVVLHPTVQRAASEATQEGVCFRRQTDQNEANPTPVTIRRPTVTATAQAPSDPLVPRLLRNRNPGCRPCDRAVSRSDTRPPVAR